MTVLGFGLARLGVLNHIAAHDTLALRLAASRTKVDVRLSNWNGHLELASGVALRGHFGLGSFPWRAILDFLLLLHSEIALDTLVNLVRHLIILNRSSFNCLFLLQILQI